MILIRRVWCFCRERYQVVVQLSWSEKSTYATNYYILYRQDGHGVKIRCSPAGGEWNYDTLAATLINSTGEGWSRRYNWPLLLRRPDNLLRQLPSRVTGSGSVIVLLLLSFYGHGPNNWLPPCVINNHPSHCSWAAASSSSLLLVTVCLSFLSRSCVCRWATNVSFAFDYHQLLLTSWAINSVGYAVSEIPFSWVPLTHILIPPVAR